MADADADEQVRLNRGFLALALGQYPAALGEFSAAHGLAPSSAVAANNVAVCQLYCCRLSDAITTLEQQLKRDPAGSSATLVANLQNLYQ